jgi:hypothetical protein
MCCELSVLKEKPELTASFALFSFAFFPAWCSELYAFITSLLRNSLLCLHFQEVNHPSLGYWTFFLLYAASFLFLPFYCGVETRYKVWRKPGVQLNIPSFRVRRCTGRQLVILLVPFL